MDLHQRQQPKYRRQARKSSNQRKKLWSIAGGTKEMWKGGIQSYEIKWLFRQAFNVHPRTWRLIYSSSAVRIDWARHGPERLRGSGPFGPGVAFSSSIHIKGLRFMAALCIPFDVLPCFQHSQAWVREQYHESQYSLWQKDLKQ